MWVKLKAAAVKEDGDAEVIAVGEAPSRLLDPLDLGVDPFGGGVGDVVFQVGGDVVEAFLQRPRQALDGLEA